MGNAEEFGVDRLLFGSCSQFSVRRRKSPLLAKPGQKWGTLGLGFGGEKQIPPRSLRSLVGMTRLKQNAAERLFRRL